MHRLGLSAIILFCVFSLTSYATYGQQTVVFNAPDDPKDPRYQYTYTLMDRILAATAHTYPKANITSSQVKMTRQRLLMELQKGQLINVIAEAPKPDWDANLIKVPIPIRKGLQGYRIFIIAEKNQALLASVNHFNELAQIPTGSGIGWSTRTAMENARMRVVTSPSYRGLFGMLALGRFDTFGRGINEAFDEVQVFHQQYPTLMVDEHVLLHIPLHTYYYVSPNQPILAERIEIGLLTLINNGEFDKLYNEQHCADILKAKLSHRKIFSIDNPYMQNHRIHARLPKDFMFDPLTHANLNCQTQ